MRIKEIEEEFEFLSCVRSDCEEADFGRKIIPKLLAVAKAVKEMPTLKIPHDVLDALEDLENEE